MQTSASVTCIILGLKGLTDIGVTIIQLLHLQRATVNTLLTKLFFVPICAIVSIPIIGAIWLGSHPTDTDGKLLIVMCWLSIMFGQTALILGSWHLFRRLNSEKYFRGAAVFIFLTVVSLDAVGLRSILNIGPNHCATILLSVGNGLAFLYLLIAFPVLARRNLFSRSYRKVLWALLGSCSCIPLLITLPLYLHDEWVILGTLINIWYSLFPWMVLLLYNLLTGKDQSEGDSAVTNVDLGSETNISVQRLV